ncbi:MAG: hypothetical protein U9N34_09700, partial [Candidatus Cloacimonadota bacterium]|nr:hypothetical protein [Candidatus Cloacimonadota bacterium]
MKKFTTITLLSLLILTIQAIDFPTFKEFQNHIKAESHRVMNSETHAKIRAERNSRNYEIGDTKDFWRWDFSNMPPAWEIAQATCRAVGEHCYIFVSDDQWNTNMNQDDVDTILPYLEETTMNGDDFGAIEMDIDLFGEIPDELDNDEKIIVYYSDLGSFQGSVFDGYFSAYNQVTEEEAQTMNPSGHSNECEMLYMTCHPLNPTEPVRISVLSHELQHMIHWLGDENETTWVDEGMAELAMVHFGMPDPISSFNSNPNYSLNMWDQQWKDYVKVLLFFTYLDEHFVSENLIADIVSEPLNGIAGITNQLNEHEFTTSFEELFSNWVVANFLDEEDIYDGLYNYESLDIPTFSYSNYSIDEEESGTIQPWATKYFKIFHENQLSMMIDLNHNIDIALIKKGTDINSEVSIISVDGTEDLLFPELEEGFSNHTFALVNNNDSSLTYNFTIQEVANNNDSEEISDL